MTTTAEIEAALADAWTLDNLAVYGDHLQQLGDPRGELIAVDLHIAHHGSSPEIQHRRRRAIRAWLGLPDHVDPTRGAWEGVRFAFGFVDDLRIELASKILSGPAGPYVRGVTLTRKQHTISTLLHELAAAPRPWLDRLTILPRSKGSQPSVVWHAGGPILEEQVELIAATPRLTRLELAGHRLLTGFSHPHVRSLRVDGIDAFLPILEPSRPLPAVIELELGFAHAPDAPVTMQRPWPPLVPAESFPALRRLDLSANETQRAMTDTQVDVFDVLPQLGVLEQLVELRLPSIRTSQEAELVRRTIARMPLLRRLEVSRGLGKHTIERDGVEVVEVIVPWPRWDRAPIGPISARCAGDRQAFWLDLREMIRICERSFRWFDDAARQAWLGVWQSIEGLSNIPARVSSTVFRDALETVGFLDASFPELRTWVAFRERLRELALEVDVSVAFFETA